MSDKDLRSSKWPGIFEECGCCGQYHAVDFYGDCRDDDHRWTWDELPNGALVFELDEETDTFIEAFKR